MTIAGPLYMIILGPVKFLYLCFYPPPDEVGAGGISVASDVRPDVRISFPEQNSVTCAWIF